VLESNLAAEQGVGPADYQRCKDLSRQVAALKRATVLMLRNQNRINDEVMRKLERELDFNEVRYSTPEHG